MSEINELIEGIIDECKESYSGDRLIKESVRVGMSEALNRAYYWLVGHVNDEGFRCEDGSINGKALGCAMVNELDK